ncbi:cob(I)yrinic acid a,c-diamide adenosyltransferase [Anoxynatronum sibiricum]|uniref:Corrinoid adenosyltransferase n=1 Tax=Anoxynatronum sibiricum TaxID=210623 RepID=A0ABU9VR83_9CLOT
MKIYTRKGDNGETSLWNGDPIFKDESRVECYGTVDELNSFISVARESIENEEVVRVLTDIQLELFVVGGELATRNPEKLKAVVTQEHIWRQERIIDVFMSRVPDIHRFVIPGESLPGAHLHVARTVCRRLERRILWLTREEEVSDLVLTYVNRLSDTLFALALYMDMNETNSLHDTAANH